MKEDIEALEDRSALGDMGQYVALRQIRQTTAKLLARLPARPVRPLPNRREVPTRVLDEDQYPVGGYTSISTNGSIESLLHSQLAYIEDSTGEPDLFDVKYTRDELFYYSRDENQFLRRRRTFVLALAPDLIDRLRRRLASSPALAWLAATLEELGPDVAVLKLPYREQITNGSGTVHGGVLAALIDLAADWAMIKTLGRPVPTIDLRVDFHSPAMPGDLTCHCKVVKVGSQFSSSESFVFDTSGKLLASGRGTYFTARPKI